MIAFACQNNLFHSHPFHAYLRHSLFLVQSFRRFSLIIASAFAVAIAVAIAIATSTMVLVGDVILREVIELALRAVILQLPLFVSDPHAIQFISKPFRQVGICIAAAAIILRRCTVSPLMLPFARRFSTQTLSVFSMEADLFAEVMDVAAHAATYKDIGAQWPLKDCVTNVRILRTEGACSIRMPLRRRTHGIAGTVRLAVSLRRQG